MAEEKPAEKKTEGMTEMEKYRAGEPFNSAKLWNEMDESFWDATMDGMKEGVAEDPKAEKPAPPAKPDPAA